MKIPAYSRGVLANLYSAAAAFRELACWDWMSDTDVFGVQDPDSGEIGYCCVLGEFGEVFGLVVYRGSEGLEQHRKIQTGKFHAGSPEAAHSQNCLTAWFCDRSELEKDELKIVRQLGLKLQGSNVWPQFRSMRPGYYPWYVTENEAKFLTLCLEQACHVALCFRDDPDFLTAPVSRQYRVRVPVEVAGQPVGVEENTGVKARVKDPPAGQQLLFDHPAETKRWEWHDQWLKPASVIKSTVRSSPVDEVRLRRILKTSQRGQGIWEADAFFMPSPVEGEVRPYFPYLLLCADHDSGFIFDSVMAEPGMWEGEFVKGFLDCLEKLEVLPGALWIRHDDLRVLFEPVAARLGIEVHSTKKLPAVDRAKREFFKYLKRQG